MNLTPTLMKDKLNASLSGIAAVDWLLWQKGGGKCHLKKQIAFCVTIDIL